MAYSKEKDFQRWIKHLKYRQDIEFKHGMVLESERIKKKIVTELKRHESK